MTPGSVAGERLVRGQDLRCGGLWSQDDHDPGQRRGREAAGSTQSDVGSGSDLQAGTQSTRLVGGSIGVRLLRFDGDGGN